MTITARAIGAAAALLALSGCLSLGAKVPDQLLNLTATSTAPAGSAVTGTSQSALAVIDIQAPQALDVTRIPVRINGSSLAYVKDAQWVEKPARLFERLLSDTLRAKGNRVVLTGSDLEDTAANKLSGTLSAMEYDASQGAVVVRHQQAVLVHKPDGFHLRVG